jgi:hypothetical protein
VFVRQHAALVPSSKAFHAYDDENGMSGGIVDTGETIEVKGRIKLLPGGALVNEGGTLDATAQVLSVDSDAGSAGTATLVNGAVQVTGVRLKSTSLVFVTYRTMLGLAGSLEVANRVAMDGATLGTFDIVSSSSEDLSTVNWAVIQPE